MQGLLQPGLVVGYKYCGESHAKLSGGLHRPRRHSHLTGSIFLYGMPDDGMPVFIVLNVLLVTAHTFGMLRMPHK